MPYRLSERTVDGKHKYCMTAIHTGKTYCYDSKEGRANGIIMHQRYAHEKEKK